MNATPASRGWEWRGGSELRGSLRRPAGATFNGKSKETSVCMEHMSWLRAVGAAAAWMPVGRGWEGVCRGSSTLKCMLPNNLLA